MIIFIGLVLLLSLYNCKPLFSKKFYGDYCSIEQTRSINGICILLILLSHTFAKVSSNGILDDMYKPLLIFLGQFVVVPFLFYSGYGVMVSINKKDSYIKEFPRKRLCKIFFQFSIITILYIILHLILKSHYTVSKYLLSFIGVTSIGNGGWYILSTFVFYVSLIVCFNIFKKNKIMQLLR